MSALKSHKGFLAFALSIILHALMYFLLTREPRARETVEKIEVSFQENFPKESVSIGKQILQDLPKIGYREWKTHPKKFQGFDPDLDTLDEDPLSDNPHASWGSGAASFGRIKNYLLYKRIYEKVDGSLFYPGVLARRHIQGTVNARLVLNKLGSCDWSKTKIQGAEPFLQLYVLDLLKKTCRNSFKREIGDRLLTNVDLSFEFAVTEADSQSFIDSHKFIVGNSLYFYRDVKESVMEWKLGPIRGLFPLPVMALDYQWVLETWDQLINDKDPIKEFKKEFSQERTT